MSAEPSPPSPGRRRALTALGILAVAAAIVLEQWCNYKSHAHDPMPPMTLPSGAGSATY